MNKSLTNEEEQELIDFLCWKYSSFPLLELARFLGNKEFLRFIDKFSGCYLRIPRSKNMSDHIERHKVYLMDLEAKRLYQEGKLTEWNALREQCLEKLKEMGRKNPIFALRMLHLDYRPYIKWMKELKEREKKDNES
jgi:hypothetical protein